MACPTLRRAAVLLLGVLAACTADVNYPAGGVQYDCSSSGTCPNNMTCNPVTHRCVTQGGDHSRTLGESCAKKDDCASGNCVDGVCCNTACDTTCERCDLSNPDAGAVVGTCSAIPYGQDPDNECDSESSGRDHNCLKRCNGNRNCAPIPIGIKCGDCKACDDTGQCTGCGAYACGANLSCNLNCSVGGDSACAADYHCVSGVCELKTQKALGQSCGADGECSSAHCVGGLCCAVSSCAASSGSPCGNTGQCKADGSACETQPATAVCHAQT